MTIFAGNHNFNTFAENTFPETDEVHRSDQVKIHHSAVNLLDYYLQLKLDHIRQGKDIFDLDVPSLDNLMDTVHQRFWYDI